MFYQVRSYNFNYYFIILTGGHNINSKVKSLNTIGLVMLGSITLLLFLQVGTTPTQQSNP